MSGRTITITAKDNIVILRGWRVAELARQAGLRPTFAGTVRGWMLDANRLPDLVAHLDYQNVRYVLEGHDRPAMPAAAPQHADVVDTPEGGLW